jgi:hypothetical protein
VRKRGGEERRLREYLIYAVKAAKAEYFDTPGKDEKTSKGRVLKEEK